MVPIVNINTKIFNYNTMEIGNVMIIFLIYYDCLIWPFTHFIEQID